MYSQALQHFCLFNDPPVLPSVYTPMPNEPTHSIDEGMREVYQQTMLAIAAAFAAGASGPATLRKRSDAVDALVLHLWQLVVGSNPALAKNVALIALGGYGRRELFPYSDVDLLFLLDPKLSDKVIEATIKDPIRRMSQSLWDCGLRVSPVTRKLSEIEKFDPENTEFALALLDQRFVCGDESLYDRLATQAVPKFFDKERDAILRRLAEITVARHAKYGGTLFHLEPNIKDCPGGLRDVHVCGWVTRLLGADKQKQAEGAPDNSEFHEAVAFLQLLRCFLHFRHERDDNTLDWQAQDAAAAAGIGIANHNPESPQTSSDAAYWMRLYFRNARVIERKAMQMLEEAPLPAAVNGRFARLTGFRSAPRSRRKTEMAISGMRIDHGAVVFDPIGDTASHHSQSYDPAHDPETVLRMFESMARMGYRLGIEAEERLSQALPILSGELEEGIVLWRHIEEILSGPYAGSALRAMHALGILELLIPEFHGIDALVIRDAYHRYTVDEHTFVLIDTLHDLEAQPPLLANQANQSPASAAQPAPAGDFVNPMAEWASRFGQILRDLQQPGLLYLVALLHDTGKGRSTRDHSLESVRMAENVLSRLELDGYESNLVLRLIGCHLEMSAALRRDIFDSDTVGAFAAKVQTPEALRMLTLFTYADIQAVHPDALTPWKAENLWRLYLATSNYLDRNVDEERVGLRRENEQVLRVTATIPSRRAEVEAFLEGLPARYLSTRTPEQVRTHFERSTRFAEDKVQIEFIYSPGVSEITLITPDRPLLFADMTGALAAWGMNIITADAFANRQGIVLDSFRFTDAFRTLEMNVSERDRFVASVHDVVTGAVAVETLLHGKRRGKRKPMVTTSARVDFDDVASAHSTLVQVVAQDTPGLLRVLSLTLAARECNIDVALVDTEGETAIDVFYVTKHQAKLGAGEEEELRSALLQAIEEHSR